MQGHARRITSALRELAGRLPAVGKDTDPPPEQVKAYAAVTRLRANDPDELISPEILHLVNGT